MCASATATEGWLISKLVNTTAEPVEASLRLASPRAAARVTSRPIACCWCGWHSFGQDAAGMAGYERALMLDSTSAYAHYHQGRWRAG
jgi:hypothetical protein